MFWKKPSKEPKELISFWIEINYKIWQEKIYKTRNKHKLLTNSRKNDFILPYIIISFISNKIANINIYIQNEEAFYKCQINISLSLNQFFEVGFFAYR